MKKFLICLLCMFICVLGKAATETINWRVDGNTYATTTCQTGGDITLPPAPTKYGYTFQGWVSGYVFLEYIESTGTQYIDTDIYVDFAQNFKVNGRFYNPDASKRKVILGNFIENQNGVFNIELKANPAYFRTYFTVPTTVDVASSVAVPVNELVSYNVNYDAVLHKSTTIVNGSSFVADVPASSAVSINPLRFFLDWRTPNTVIANPIGIGKTEIYKADALVRSFVPAKRNSDNVIGMYDLVSGQFFTNAGVGEFIAGPVINQ